MCIRDSIIVVYTCVGVGVVQADCGRMIDGETIEHNALDLTRVNHLLAVLSHQKQLLEQVHSTHGLLLPANVASNVASVCLYVVDYTRTVLCSCFECVFTPLLC